MQSSNGNTDKRVYQVSCIINIKDEDLITEQLFARGATSLSSEATAKEMIKLTAIFDTKPHLEGLHLQHWFVIERLYEHSWKNLWARNYQGSEINQNIIILPYNANSTNEWPHPYTILLDPRNAFGDGNHATTFLCLNTIDKHLRRQTEDQRAKMDVFDIGTGTGILALLCSFMGVGSVDAIDIDSESIEVARSNAQINNCKNINFATEDLSSCTSGKTYDLVIANILTKEIQANFNILLDLIKNDGALILSGISSKWHTEMLELFKRQQATLCEHTQKDDWNCYLIHK